MPRRLVRDELGVLLVLGLLIAAIGIPYPDFLGTDNLLSTAHNSVYISLMACGMVFAPAMREVDLSVGGSYAMCLVVGALLVREGVPPWLAVPVVLLTGIVLGVFNALVTTLPALPSFIVTLGTLMLYRGVGLALADGRQITDLPLDDSFLTFAGGDPGGVPFALWVLLAVVAGLAVVLARTRFGARVRAIGSNPDAAAFSGIPVVRTRIQALALSGFTTACAAALALALYGAGDPTLGQRYELQAIAACIIGGTLLTGGRGSVVGGGGRGDDPVGRRRRARVLRSPHQLDVVRDRRGDPRRGRGGQRAAPDRPPVWERIGVARRPVTFSRNRVSEPAGTARCTFS
ncbi:ABC transporter permease [Streptomyces sp. AS02]|uniref:ABC transporter permease n=1 Tax=Streptomyces sp. AS02 TaxID=2938946 RepID=UPI0020204D75|nr:ABC transporter permease [Streptomyces sp. AS02]MCL8013570.1 ABC transporter permease [Streptomyces sp. AS02]